MKQQAAIIFALLVVYLFSCNSSRDSDIASDPATIAAGQSIFNENCSACHNFRIDGIGPQLGGITGEVTADWLKSFIRNPKAMIDSGDTRARQTFERFKAVMPSFTSFSDAEVNALVAFLHTKQKAASIAGVPDTTVLKDPIPRKIQVSEVVAGLEPFCKIPASSKELPLTRITKMAVRPSTTELYVNDLRGKLYRVEKNTWKVYLDMAALKLAFIHQPGLATGFGSFAFHPEFANNGLLYTTHTEPAGSQKADFAFADSIPVILQWVLTEWKTSNPSSFPFSGTPRELFRVDMVTGIHGVQEITFNPHARPGTKDYGLLYVGVGDGGCVEAGYPALTHSTDKVWGTVLRIDPAGNNSRNGKYGIPADNPFVGRIGEGTVREIYAIGFRNPHRIGWTSTGQMLVPNIGQKSIESLNLVEPGKDYGWPIREGTFVIDAYGDINKAHPLPPDDSIYQVTYPVAQYDHDEGKAISGGYEYTGSAVPALKGKFIFGDIPDGRLFYVDIADIRQGAQAEIKEWKITVAGADRTLVDLCGTTRVDLHFGQDAHGELFVLTKPDGMIYRIVDSKKAL